MDSLLNTAPCGFVSFTDEGTMREVNATLGELLGYTRFELEGWHLQKILPPGGRVFYHTHFFPLLRLQGKAEEIYFALRTQDGRDIPVLMNAVRRERDGSTFNDCVIVPMQQRHRYEDELLHARRAADQANAARGKFLSMMSHDLRTPLTAISGLAKLLEAGVYGPISGEQAQMLRRMNSACGELLRMINDILAFAQLESGRVEVRRDRVPLTAALERAETLIRVRAQQAGLTLVSDAGTHDAAVLADADKLQQLLLNLLTNAIKFTSTGGTISVACETSGERTRIHVRDTGVGIPEEQIEQIFDPFVQLEHQPADATQRGVGLGLAISRDLARAMGGELTVTSVAGEGSVFTVELPSA
ncbi:MAG TPA: HAMP domain-containing sensor histidine kinase [Thermoanaerobaculia bacterium]